MDKTEREGLEKAYWKEKDSRILRNVATTHYRTVKFKLDIFKFAHRRRHSTRINDRRYSICSRGVDAVHSFVLVLTGHGQYQESNQDSAMATTGTADMAAMIIMKLSSEYSTVSGDK